MSAIQEEAGDFTEPIQVLFTMHNNMNALDFTGPLEVLNYAQHDIKDEGLHSSHLSSPEDRRRAILTINTSPTLSHLRFIPTMPRVPASID